MRSGWLAAALVLTARPGMGQAKPAIPAWLENYPGVTAQTATFQSLLEVTYAAGATPAAVTAHYRKLFEAHNLPFVPNFDGMGTVVRGAAVECDLMITIRAQDQGTAVKVDCAAKTAPAEAWSAVPSGSSDRPLRTTAGGRMPRPSQDHETRVAEADARHKQLVKDMNIHPVYQDAPAPPMVWPEWLVNLEGSRLNPQAGVDQSGRKILKYRYRSKAPMTAIFAFYEDLLNANGYPVHNSKLGTGQTISGIMQNADGYVEGTQYVNGFPGPYTEIRVQFSRFVLNEPITVDLKFTPHDFKAPPRFEH